MPSLNRNEKVTCEVCSSHATKLNHAHHKQSCSAGTFYCTQCLNFSTNSQSDLTYHINKKHCNATARFVQKCKTRDKDFHSFYLLREHKRKENGAQRCSGPQNDDITHLMGDIDD